MQRLANKIHVNIGFSAITISHLLMYLNLILIYTMFFQTCNLAGSTFLENIKQTT